MNDFPGRWTNDQLQEALCCVYDTELADELMQSDADISELVCMVIMDASLQQYLSHLDKYDWDRTAAALSWSSQ